MYRTLANLREKLTPISHHSRFLETGQITPEEFIRAGDYLVNKFPTWAWASAPSHKQRNFLPKDKQVLVSKVPSHGRVANVDTDEKQGENDDWVVSARETQEEEVLDIDDLDDFDEDNIAVDKNSRTYNVYITYSTSYRVPKAYLSGFDADGSPLPPAQMFEDIVPEYRDKTATIENAPFNDLVVVSIHPCKHAKVMRSLLDKTRTTDSEWDSLEDLNVDKYMLVFLKFIASITPTIEYDFTYM